ncbi:MAG TPA: hypothetical protein VIK91_19815, partial [Nannocystis sp.]
LPSLSLAPVVPPVGAAPVSVGSVPAVVSAVDVPDALTSPVAPSVSPPHPLPTSDTPTLSTITTEPSSQRMRNLQDPTTVVAPRVAVKLPPTCTFGHVCKRRRRHF